MAATGNAEVTKERILSAATAEFSACGIAGARVDRIAAAADCNKNLIYVYFHNKENLFNAVLGENLSRVYAEVFFTAEDLPGYAQRLFDYVMDNPALMRLEMWATLEGKEGAEPGRRKSAGVKIETLAEQQREGRLGTDFPPAFLLVAVMTLATAWSAAAPYGPSLDPSDGYMPQELRNLIADAVRRIAPTT